MMYHCAHCGSAITASFARVFADRDGKVHHCPHCQHADVREESPAHAAGSADAQGVGSH